MTPYRQFFEELERRLGRVLLPIDSEAQAPSKIVSCHAACLDIARRAAEEIYDENACASLEDPVSLFPTLDALGKIKRQQREKDALDVVAADFLEALGLDRKSTRLNSSHSQQSRMPSSA